jgi:hypothetical protein
MAVAFVIGVKLQMQAFTRANQPHSHEQSRQQTGQNRFGRTELPWEQRAHLG